MVSDLPEGKEHLGEGNLKENIDSLRESLERARGILKDELPKKNGSLREKKPAGGWLASFIGKIGMPERKPAILKIPESEAAGGKIFFPDDFDATNILSVERIGKKFGRNTVLDNVSFSFRKGTILGLLGPNGSGKSTLIRILSGLLNADEGSFCFRGSAIGDSTASIKKHLGVVPQEEMFYRKFSVEENIGFFGMLYGLEGKRLKERKEFLLDWFGLGEFREKKAETLSGGYRRLLNIACSVVHDPEIVFLDEPTVGLDPKFRKLLWQRITEMRNSGKSILITTHYMDEASELCDEIVLLFSGKVLVEGKPLHLVNEYGGTTSILLTLDSAPMQSTVEKIKGIVPNAMVRQKGNELLVSVFGRDPIESAYEIDELLKGSGERVVSFVLREPTLEDVFLNLVGKAEGIKRAESF
jgi:ABC-2 type transport system ATP-binding protein